MADFLLEIGLEEIPARMINEGQALLAVGVAKLLGNERLLDKGQLESFSSPRRISVFVPGIRAAQPDMTEEIIGPSIKIAYKDGAPTPAAEAFAKKAGIPLSKLTKVSNAKGEYLAATVEKKGRAASDVLVEFLPKEIASMYWAKNMYWRAGKPERFVRPV